ncbi:MAG TPA: FAD-binding oxidoreductase, partial [Alphaproteobacteria bacterium]|nr:FAD-binding oxidoreductase [Alphaproteobacteria bacterium]
AGSDGEMQEVRRKTGIERKFGIQVEVLDKKDLQQIAPYISESMVGGAFYPEEGKANPLLVTPAFANQAERYGVKIIRQAEVESIAIEGRGFTANTTKGAITCRRIGNCAGADAARIGAMVGLKLPVRGHPIQVSVTEPIAPVVEHLVYSASDRLTLKQTRHGSCIIGGGWPSGIDPVTGRLKVESDSMMRNLQIAIQTVPRLRHAQLVRTWPAVVNGTENWRPILGEASNVKGFVMNVFPWMGFTAGPASSRVTADLMLGRRPSTAFEVFLEID